MTFPRITEPSLYAMMTEKTNEPTREALYELVWAKPMPTVAAELNISDVALAKRCRKLGI